MVLSLPWNRAKWSLPVRKSIQIGSTHGCNGFMLAARIKQFLRNFSMSSHCRSTTDSNWLMQSSGSSVFHGSFMNVVCSLFANEYDEIKMHLVLRHRQPIQDFFMTAAWNRTGFHDFNGLTYLFFQLFVLQYKKSFVAHLSIRQIHFGENEKNFGALQTWIGQQCVQQNAYYSYVRGKEWMNECVRTFIEHPNSPAADIWHKFDVSTTYINFETLPR